jgi:hypothetical protein
VLREPERFYPTFAGSLLRFVMRGRLRAGTDKAVVYADSLPISTNRKKEAVLKTMKTTCAGELPKGSVYHTFSHRRESNCWLQIADYCCWSLARKWESGDPRTYGQLRGRLAAPELEVTANSSKTYYLRKRMYPRRVNIVNPGGIRRIR